MKSQVERRAEEFRVEIRRKHRKAMRDSIKSRHQELDSIQKWVNLILVGPQCMNKAISELSYILGEYDVDELPQRLILELKRVYVQLQEVCVQCDTNHPSQLHRDIIHLMCALSCRPELADSYSTPIISMLVSQLAHYIFPTPVFYSCLVALGNLLLASPQLGELCYSLMEQNCTETILYHLISLKNEDRTDRLAQSAPLMSLFADSNEQILQWFVNKYLRYLIKEEKGFQHRRLPAQIVQYVSMHLHLLKKYQGEQTKFAETILTHIVNIIQNAKVPINREFCEKTIIPIVTKYVQTESAATLWKYVVIETDAKLDCHESLLEGILTMIWEDGEAPQFCKRNKLYLEGIYGILLKMEQGAAEQIWRTVCGRQMFENLMLREDIGSQMDRIVGYVGEIGSEEQI